MSGSPILSKSVTAMFVVYYVTTMIFPHNTASESNRLIPQFTMALIAMAAITQSIKNIHTVLNFRLFKPFVFLVALQIPYIFIIAKGFSLMDNAINFLKYNSAIFSMLLWFCLFKSNHVTNSNNFFIILAFQIFYGLYTLYEDLYLSSSLGNAYDSNAGFILVCCIPPALVVPQKRLRIYLYLIIALGCIISGQRSAALAAVISFPFCARYLKNCFTRADKYILLVILVFVIVPALNFAYSNIMVRMNEDFERGSMGSGRSIFWAITWTQFWAGDIFHIIFGNGYGELMWTLKNLYGHFMMSHNGWLDYMHMFGIAGVYIYLLILLNIIRMNKIYNQYLSNYRNILLIVAILFLVRCSTSHGYWDISVIPLGMTLGYISAIVDFKEDEYFNNTNS